MSSLASSDVLNYIHFIYKIFFLFLQFLIYLNYILVHIIAHNITCTYTHFFCNIMTLTSHSPAHVYSRVITDFVQTFERDTGLTMASCRDIVEDSNDIFHEFSYLIKHLFSLIDSCPCEIFTIKGLNVPQRRDFYIELSQIGIHFTKNIYLDDNRNHCTDICISTVDIWSVPDYRGSDDVVIYQYWINVFNGFYSHVENLLTTRTATNGNIIVSMENFLKFKRIFADAITSYHQQRYNTYNNINNIVYMPNQPSSAPTPARIRTHCQPRVLSNTKIKHQLADLIFDIKDDLTDAMYKEILEKIALISP